MSESVLNRVLFRSPLSRAVVRTQGNTDVPQRHVDGPDPGAVEFARWTGRYFNSELDQTWGIVEVGDSLWVVPDGEAAQLLSPNGPDGMRSRGVNLWITGRSILVAAVDEVTADWIELWFERR